MFVDHGYRLRQLRRCLRHGCVHHPPEDMDHSEQYALWGRLRDSKCTPGVSTALVWYVIALAEPRYVLQELSLHTRESLQIYHPRWLLLHAEEHVMLRGFAPVEATRVTLLNANLIRAGNLQLLAVYKHADET